MSIFSTSNEIRLIHCKFYNEVAEETNILHEKHKYQDYETCFRHLFSLLITFVQIYVTLLTFLFTSLLLTTHISYTGTSIGRKI